MKVIEICRCPDQSEAGQKSRECWSRDRKLIVCQQCGLEFPQTVEFLPTKRGLLKRDIATIGDQIQRLPCTTDGDREAMNDALSYLAGLEAAVNDIDGT